MTVMPAPLADCLFCSIVVGSAPAEVVYRDAEVVAFRDINPQAPTHLLLVPTAHYENAAELALAEPAGLTALVLAAAALAKEHRLDLSGYRMVFNTGAGAGQTVFHAHLHLLGGRSLTWPPG